MYITIRPPLWSSGQSFWLQIQRSRVRSPALPDFLSSSGSWASWGQLRSYLNEKSSGSRSRKQRLMAVGTRCPDHVTPLYPQKLALTLPTGGGCSVGIVRVRSKATEFSFFSFFDRIQEGRGFWTEYQAFLKLNLLLISNQKTIFFVVESVTVQQGHPGSKCISL